MSVIRTIIRERWWLIVGVEFAVVATFCMGVPCP